MDNITDFEVNSPRWLSLEDFEGEVWKDIPGYEGYYQASNMGRIKSLDRIMYYGRGNRVKRSVGKKIVKGSLRGLYYICHLSKCGNKKLVKIHRLVCSLFHENPNNWPEVNHINEIKTDNRAENLEWCTREYNINWGTAIERLKRAQINHPAKSRVIYQYTLDGKFVKKFPSAKEAERCTGINSVNILSVCRGSKSSSAGGFLWSYTQEPKAILDRVKRKEKGLKIYSKKKVCQYTLDGEFIREYDSINEAAYHTTALRYTISACCRHVPKYHSAGGYKWEYSDTPDRDERAKQKVPIRPKKKTFKK